MDSKIQELLAIDFFNDIGMIGLYETDEDRVKLILNNIDLSLNVTLACQYGKKSSEESEKFRNCGNLLFNTLSPNLEEVLKYYSKSIIYALPGTEQLALAYANRSAVLFRGKYYEECLEDISRALKTGYPDNLKPKLLIRRVTCNYALTGNVDFEKDKGLIEARELIEKLPATNKMRRMVEDTLNNSEKITSVERQVKKTHSKYQPEMKGRSPHLPGASDAISLRYSEEFGRHLVATRDINSGEVLLIEKPYAMIVPDEWIYCICSHCARRTWNGIPCDYCVYVMFCSAECKQAAWEEYHDVECEVLGIAKKMQLVDSTFMGLRLTVKAIKEAGSLETLRKRLKALDSVKASDVEIPINPNSYETFYIMSDHPKRYDWRHLALYSGVAGKLTYFLVVKTNIFGKKAVSDLRLIKDSGKFLFAACLMLKNLRIASNRAYGMKVAKEQTNEDRIMMLMPISNFLNSRCYHTTELLRFDENMIVVTPVPINKDEQIYTHYYLNYNQASRDSRREVLKEEWQFVCNCLACTEDWSDCISMQNDQQMPKKVMLKLGHELQTSKWLNPGEVGDPMGLILAKDRLCKLIDDVYPQLKKPSNTIEKFVNVLNSIYMKLSFTTFSRFIDKL